MTVQVMNEYIYIYVYIYTCIESIWRHTGDMGLFLAY